MAGKDDLEVVDQSLRLHFLLSATQYYVAGRWSILNNIKPICANLLHHAVEMYLKSHFSLTMSLERIRKLGHDLPRLWSEFKNKIKNEQLSNFDDVVEKLHKF